ncbi:MAG: enolase C-terminal domain-like protein [Anaerolineae bacterium]|jgi:enolase|nr:phosphopyruvate hydratase [Chloroflexota bacterium]
MASKIKSVQAREIMGSRAPALEVIVTTDTGATGRSTPETGVSMGAYEAAFVMDGGERLGGQGVRQAAANAELLGRELVGMEVSRQREIDNLLIALDGTPNKRKYGANTLVGLSLAVCAAGANAAGLPLYQYVGGVNAATLPMPIFGICLSGRYRDPGDTRWLKPSYEIIPHGAGSFERALDMADAMHREFTRLVLDKYGLRVYRRHALERSYDSFWMVDAIQDDREILDLMTRAIENTHGTDNIGIYYDAAAGTYYEADIDRYVGIYSAGEKTRDEMVAYYTQLVRDYPILSIEDPLHEEDWEGHAMVTEATGIEIVGDDLFTTNIERVKLGVAAGAANSMVLKITQVGTVTEALDAARYCHAHGYNVHPCGSRGDRSTIADYALGLSAGQVRAYDQRRMMAFEADLGSAAIWPGKALFKGDRNR